MKCSIYHKGALLALVGLVFSAPVSAQYTWQGCSDLQQSDFQRTELFSRSGSAGAVTVADLSEPVAMAFNAVKMGDSVIGSDIYFVQRRGSVRKYDFTTKTVKQIGLVNTAETATMRQGDNGLMGIEVDPNFATNRHIYLWYSPPRVGSNNYRGRLSRFTLGAQDTLLADSEKILIDILLSKTHQWHAGGPMRFDAHGDLWVTIGNNGSDLSGSGSQYSPTDSNQNQEWGASNTASMRGGVIRIKPDNSVKGYSIPSGNFGEYWADYFEANGNATLAAQYRDPAKVLPEVYVKGTRSNFSIWVHPTKRWLAWGEVNYQSNNDEYNLITTPAFTGFPYFHRNNIATPGTITPAKVASAPTNLSVMNTGVQQLPPATSAAVWHGTTITATTFSTNVAQGGDVYIYNRNLKSAVKFPPHFHHVWLMMPSTSGNNPLYGIKIDSTTVTVTGMPQRLDNGVLSITTSPANLRRAIQASYGPDGALYFLNYGGGDYANTANSGVLRVTYNGNCQLEPVALSPHKPLSDLRMTLHAGRLRILEAGRHEVLMFSADGREVFRAVGEAGASYDLKTLRGASTGVYSVRVKTAQGTYARTLSLL
jgi:cytochrome c